MYSFEKTLNDFRSQLQGKKLVSGKEIVALGVVAADATLCTWRARGNGPPYLKLSKGKYLYPVDGLLSWIEKSLIIPTSKENTSAAHKSLCMSIITTDR